MNKDRKTSAAPIVKRISKPDFNLYYNTNSVLMVETMPDKEYNAAMVLNILEEINAFTEGKKVLVLTLAGTFSSISIEGLKALSSPKAFSYAHAKAYVINSLAQRMALNFYLRCFKPQIPIRLFTNLREAEAWLLKNFRQVAKN